MSERTAYALTFVLKDRTGIVADVTKVLYENGFNIADSSSTLLQGIFSMILLVKHDNKMTIQEVGSLFTAVGLNPSVYEISNYSAKASEQMNNFIISVYGADKPGIVHHITAKLYERKINIVDLQTQVAGKPPKEAYIMILEVLAPMDAKEEEWIAVLKETASEIGTDINIRRLETYEL